MCPVGAVPVFHCCVTETWLIRLCLLVAYCFSIISDSCLSCVLYVQFVTESWLTLCMVFCFFVGLLRYLPYCTHSTVRRANIQHVPYDNVPKNTDSWLLMYDSPLHKYHGVPYGRCCEETLCHHYEYKYTVQWLPVSNTVLYVCSVLTSLPLRRRS